MNTSDQATWYLDPFVPIKNSAISWLWITQVEELPVFCLSALGWKSRARAQKLSVYHKRKNQ